MQMSYSDFNKELKSVMFNIVEHAFTEVVRTSRGRVFDETQLACLIQSESLVEQIVKFFLPSTTFISPMVDTV